jgi:uncharacterized protein (TIGR02246 family)
MAHLRHLLALCLVLGVSPPANAGAAEEIAQLMRELDQTFNEGNLEAYMAPYADNAVFAPPNVPFRIEGKDALRAYYAGVMQTFATHRVAPRQTTTQIYDDRTAVVSRYNHAVFVDRNGHVTNFYLRQTYTWVKLAGGWSLVEQHYSALPVSQ